VPGVLAGTDEGEGWFIGDDISACAGAEGQRFQPPGFSWAQRIAPRLCRQRCAGKCMSGFGATRAVFAAIRTALAASRRERIVTGIGRNRLRVR
jgi:hypothetical protein